MHAGIENYGKFPFFWYLICLLLVFSVTPFKIDQNKNQNINRSIDKVQNLGNERRYIYILWIYDLMIAQYSTVLDSPLIYSIVSLPQLFINCEQFVFFFLFQRILNVLVSRMTLSYEKENFLVGCGVLFLYFTPCCHRVLALVCSSDLTVHTGKNHLWFNVCFLTCVYFFNWSLFSRLFCIIKRKDTFSRKKCK